MDWVKARSNAQKVKSYRSGSANGAPGLSFKASNTGGRLLSQLISIDKCECRDVLRVMYRCSASAEKPK
jgi:hypothetical protein